jgi:hypothetical protein
MIIHCELQCDRLSHSGTDCPDLSLSSTTRSREVDTDFLLDLTNYL